MKHFKAKILIVDDSKSAIKFIEELLSCFHLELFSASSAYQALDIINSTHIDIAIIDVHLPLVDGFELAQAIRNKSGYHSLPIIFISGTFTDKNSQLKGIKFGAIDYILKDNLKDILASKIQTLLEIIKYSQNLNEEFIDNDDKNKKELNDIENLKQSLNSALESSKIKSQVLMMLTHQIRTPITIINNSISFLNEYKDKLESSDYERVQKRIQNAVLNLNNLMEDSIIYTNTINGLIKVNLFPTRLIKFFNILIKEINDLNPNFEIIFNTNIKETQEFLIDQYLFKMVIENLLTNAIKYSDSSKTIVINAYIDNDSSNKKLQDDEKLLKLSITDYGIGIPESYYENMFSSFKRANNVGKIAGNGIGLTIVKNILNELNGSISFESKLGQETTFFVELVIKVQNAKN